MLPSSTVENYLKAIHHGQSGLPKGQRLLPMGHEQTVSDLLDYWRQRLVHRKRAY